MVPGQIEIDAGIVANRFRHDAGSDFRMRAGKPAASSVGR